MKIWKIAAAALAAGALMLAGPALAADNYVVKDGAGATITICALDVAGVKSTCNVIKNASGTTINPSTSDNQTSELTKLDQLHTDNGAQGTGSTFNPPTGGSGVLGYLSGVFKAVTGSLPAGNNAIGDVGTAAFAATCTTLTNPGTGGTYASGDLVANNATAGSVTPLTCTVARYSGGPVTITKARILTSTTGLTAASFRVHAYTGTPTVTNGNDGVFLSIAAGHFCRLDVTLDVAFSDGADGSGVPVSGTSCTRVLSATTDIKLLIEARGAYAWTAAQTYIVILEGFN